MKVKPSKAKPRTALEIKKPSPAKPLIKKLKPKQKIAKKKEPKTPGRKPWEPDYTKIESWASHGLFDKQIAALAGVSHEEFCRKKNQLPQLSVALETGRAKGAAACAQMLLQLALKGDKDLLKFYLERRAGWKNTTVVETLPKPVEEMTTEELLAIINGQPLK